MSPTLESCGFSPHQSHAEIKSVAFAMQTFAVAPEQLYKQSHKVMEALEDLSESINRRERTMLRY